MGLLVERTDRAGVVITDGGMAVECHLSDHDLAPGRLVSLGREGERFFAGRFSLSGQGPSANWDAFATAWRAVLRDLDAEIVLVALGEEDFSLRFAAEWELFHRGKQNLDLLRAGMESPNWRIRAGSAGLMDHLADDSCGEPLLALLRDPHEKVRRAALHSVSCEPCKDEPLCVDWVPEVVRLAQADRIVRVRRIATLMLGARREDPRAREALTGLLQDRDAKVRSRARWALDGKRPEDTPQTLRHPGKADL